MRTTRRAHLGLLLFGALGVGCNHDTTTSITAADLGVPLDMATAATPPDLGTPESPVSGQIWDGDADGGMSGIAGAQICVTYIGSSAAPICAQSDSGGNYMFDWLFEPGVDLWTFSADGYLGVTLPVWTTIGVAFSISQPLISDAAAAQLLGAAFTYPPNGTGFAQLSLQSAIDPGQRITGATASLAGAQIVYADADGRPDPSANATTASGLVYLGQLPADHPFVITVAAPNLTCSAQPDVGDAPKLASRGAGAQPRFGAPGPTDNSIQGWVAAHSLATLELHCK